MEVEKLCLSEYELVCDKCRKKCEEIFSKEPKDAEEEKRMYRKWIESLCEDCKRILRDEGFIS